MTEIEPKLRRASEAMVTIFKLDDDIRALGPGILHSARDFMRSTGFAAEVHAVVPHPRNDNGTWLPDLTAGGRWPLSVPAVVIWLATKTALTSAGSSTNFPDQRVIATVAMSVMQGKEALHGINQVD